jgi:molybdate transport system substrate-binding protein
MLLKKTVSLAVLALVLPLAGCGGDDEGGHATITVLAAASLTGAFTELADQFQKEHEGVTVKLAFDSSATLAQQAVDGAPADVLATADTATMDSATAALDGDSELFATNTMVLVTPTDNPAGITGFDDIVAGDVTYVVCVDTAPCGKVAAALLADNTVQTAPASLEVDVKAVLAKVTSGEADAGIVYATDAVAAGDAVQRFEIPHAADEVTSYPIAALKQSGDAALAQQFVDLVLSTAGQQVLADAGFGKP